MVLLILLTCSKKFGIKPPISKKNYETNIIDYSIYTIVNPSIRRYYIDKCLILW